MRFALFYHSLVSDWNHGNAHFLRGIVRELTARGHEVRVFEPADAWSVQNLVRDHGPAPLEAFAAAYPGLRSVRYDPRRFDLDAALDGVDLALVHEWNDPALVARIGERRRPGGRLRVLFHDTHHRAATQPGEMARYDLRRYDGVLAFGAVLAALYRQRGWAERAWTWHEAADTRVFRPLVPEPRPDGDGSVAGDAGGDGGDVVWIGNWGDEERSDELRTFLLEPVRELSLRTTVHGVRYPPRALAALEQAGARYRGWLPNFRAPEVFARHRATVHVPRRPYRQALPGIPTIRVFEALACGIPLVCAPWEDAEGLFRPGRDYLVARDGAEMRAHLRLVTRDRDAAGALARSGRETLLARHTCVHRVNELFGVLAELRGAAARPIEDGRAERERRAEGERREEVA